MKTNYLIIKRLSALFAITVLSINITFAQCLINSITITDACGGLCNGTIEINATGGSGIYKYSIDNGATFQGCNLFADLCSGNYSIVIDDMTGCQDSSNVIISEWSLLNVSVTFDLVWCNGFCDGALDATPAGGLAPYTFIWNTTPVQTSSVATFLCAGTYTVTVTDFNGCQAQDSGTVSEPAALNINPSTTNTTSCGGCDGTADAGAGYINYLWSTGDVSQTITNLCADNYSVTITDMNGCTASSTFAISETGGEMLTTSSTDISCNGACDGSATASFTCSDPPCSIIWSDGAGFPIGQTDTTATGLCAGDYFVQVTNNSGCISYEQVTINEPSQINTTINCTNTSCIGTCDGSTTVFVTGGVSPYTYSWSPSGQTSQTATGLCAGLHTAIVIDSLGCSDTMMVTVGSPDTIVFNTSKIDATCGACDGQAITCVTGGTTPYSYNWATGSTTFYEDSLCSGGYVVAVIDANGCIALDTNVIILELSNISIDSIVTEDVTPCFGDTNGTITIYASDGTPPYEYSIDSGSTYHSDSNFTGLGAGTYNITVQSADLCPPQFGGPLTINEPSPIFIPVSDTICDNDSLLLEGEYQNTPGIYYDTLISVNGCDSVVATTLTVNPSPVITITPSPGVVCNYGDTVMLIASGAVNYTWSPATGLNTTIGDTVLAFPSTDTTYTVTGTNIYGCIDSTTVSVQLSTVNPVASFSASTTNLCEGNTVTFNNTSTDATGYSWTFPGGTTADTTVQNPVVTYNTAGVFDVTLTALGCSFDSTITMAGYITVNPTYTTSLFDTICEGDSIQLPGGAYADTSGIYYDTLLTVDGCDSIIATTLTVNPLPVITITPSIGVVCNYGDTVMLIASGADNYTWSPAVGLNTTTGDTVLAFPLTDTTYTITGTNIYGCIDSTTVSVQLSTVIPVASFSASTTNLCEGNTVTFNNTSTDATGYSWWFPGGTTADTTVQNPFVTYNTAGVFDVTLTAFGCSTDSTITMAGYITVNPTYTTSLSDTICDGDSIQLPGGAFADTSGIYYDTLLTVDGCDSIIATTLTVNPTYDTTSSAVICEGDSIQLPGGAYANISGIYYDTLSTVNGCDSIVATNLTVNSVDTITTSESICFGDSILLGGAYQTDASIYYDTDTSSNGCDSVVVTTLTVNPLPPMPTVTVNGNQLASSPANAYQWYFYDTLIAGATSQFYTATQTGFYSVMVADINGCWSVSNPYWVTVTSINEIEFLTNLNIYPNPNTGEFIIEMNFSKSQDVEIKLFNVTGQMIYSENLKLFKGAYFKRIALKDFSIGVYLLKVKTDYGEVNNKVIVE